MSSVCLECNHHRLAHSKVPSSPAPDGFQPGDGACAGAIEILSTSPSSGGMTRLEVPCDCKKFVDRDSVVFPGWKPLGQSDTGGPGP